MSNEQRIFPILDARPDRLDLRDRAYRPHLRSLPSQFPSETEIEAFFPSYKDNQLILDQGSEGACTGFGLAATINYLVWRDEIAKAYAKPDFDIQHVKVDALVSERMLYHMARIYDEWEGEDYSGSSCRGAMKGWHRHGVCTNEYWAYKQNGAFKKPKSGWEVNALQQPLGAYYRINHDSVVDMQAAIYEVGAIYCSASVHDGWRIGRAKRLPTIKMTKPNKGGHAFCIVGYNDEGFIIQNSWGSNWGWNGFAVLTYSDWVANGSDAWVVSRGVPVKITHAPKMYANNALQDVASNRSDPKFAAINRALAFDYENDAVKPWAEDKAYQHALVIGNNGRPKQTVIFAEDADASAKHLCYDRLKAWLAASETNRKIAVYAHGGLNNEEAAINRVRVMAPYFQENGIYPLFVIWKTGLGETMRNIVADALASVLGRGQRSEGLWDFVTDKTDRAIEAIARGIHAKSLWSEMKENAIYASDRAVPGYVQNRGGKPGAMVLLAKNLEKLVAEFPDIELHLVGHSAGSILLGEWLKELKKRTLAPKTVSLFAPACTIAFANKTYKKAIEKGQFNKADLYIHNMDDEREKADNTGKVYRKSLLYLVSRALEDLHKMPLLGLDAAWNTDNSEQGKSGGFNDSQLGEMTKWAEFMPADSPNVKIYSRQHSRVKTNLNPDYIDLSHGSFDNDITVIEFTLKKIKGLREDDALSFKVENLCGY